jgi:hypothetical protein
MITNRYNTLIFFIFLKVLLFLPFKIRRPLLKKLFPNPYKNINDEHKTIFIHIPKCGGVSVENALFQQKIGHSEIWKYKAFDKKKFNQYYKFTFVRNPWDRLVSAFFFLKAGGRNPKDTEWARKHIYNYESFENFVLSLKNKKVRKKILSHQHFRPQWHYIVDENGNTPFDFIGRIENFKNDFESIKAQLGLTGDLSHINKSSHKPYSYYYKNETKKIVRELYKKDIELLNYSFDTNL